MRLHGKCSLLFWEEFMNNIIELVFIVDCSKAIEEKEFEVVSDINAIIDEYRTFKTVYVTTVTFDTNAKMVHDRLRIGEINPLTISDVKAKNGSLLYDTIARVINHIRNIHHYIRKEDIPDETIFHIFSFGIDNASTKYTNLEIQKLIYERKRKEGW